MKGLITLCSVLFFLSHNLLSQSIEGTWTTIDDITGKAKSHINIYSDNGQFYGKISKLLLSPQDKTCDACPADKKDKPLVGMLVLWGLKKDNNKEWSGGKILDPESGKVYKCKLWFEDGNYNQLNMRGYIGFSLLGRNQLWHKVE